MWKTAGNCDLLSESLLKIIILMSKRYMWLIFNTENCERNKLGFDCSFLVLIYVYKEHNGVGVYLALFWYVEYADQILKMKKELHQV